MLSRATEAVRPAGGEFRLGWPVVLGCFAAAVFAWGFAAFGPAVYLAELQRRYGWSAATIGGATTLAFVVGALLLPWVGAAIERLGARAVLSGGVFLIGVGVLGVAHAAAPWQLYAWNLAIGCGWAGASSTAISTVLAGHFDRRRGLALSLALTGASAGGFAVAPTLVALSHNEGLAVAVTEAVVGLALAVLPAIWLGLGRRGAAPAGSRIDRHRPRRAASLRNVRFWSIAGPFALAIAAQVGMMVYEVSYLLPLLGSGGTALALVCTSGAGAAGRLAVSPVIDRLEQRPVAAITFLCQAVGVGLMIALPHFPAALFLGTLLFGACMGNVVMLPSLLIQREFEPASFAQTLGLSTAIGQLAYSASPALLGIMRDLSGGYRGTLALCVALQTAAAVLVLRRPRGSR